VRNFKIWERLRRTSRSSTTSTRTIKSGGQAPCKQYRLRKIKERNKIFKMNNCLISQNRICRESRFK